MRWDIDTETGVLIDTNLFVLLIVGMVNPARIENFKRTRHYTRDDYRLLLRVLGGFNSLYTLAHIMAEVSNLTDLTGPERLQARHFLRETVATMREPAIPSVRAAASEPYMRLGLVDAAITALALEEKCAVLTDDLDLYLELSRR